MEFDTEDQVLFLFIDLYCPHLPASNTSSCKCGERAAPTAGLEDGDGQEEGEVGHGQQEQGHGDGQGEVVVVDSIRGIYLAEQEFCNKS